MTHAGRRAWAAAVLLALLVGVVGCTGRDGAGAPPPNHTAVLGSYGAPPSEAAPLTDAQGRAIPQPPVPRGVHAQVVRSGDASALAVWVQDGRVVCASYDRAHGWRAPQPLEQIYGEASDPQLASNGKGVAMALWRHTVGTIQSLRYSRYEAANGWSAPDVLPGAVPRPRNGGAQAAPKLQMDAQGNATAQWSSALHAGEVQVARYDAAQGWQPPVNERVASAQPASPARPAPSSAR